MPAPSTVEPEQPKAEGPSEVINQVDDPNPTEEEPELPKVWNIEDPFQYAPPKPDGDHWSLLLEPILKAHKMQCDAWKDEVQNLLIFAGLFSGVVTAFIIESYKNLQQSPNDAMVFLLAHIAVRLDGPLNNNTSAPFPLLNQTHFSPTASSVRVNVFWFISLVLSLTTVLVGIVSLQWLREYQSYHDLSEREKYGVSVMRQTALSHWWVDKIFKAMPLLLQCALILFLGGIVDFLNGFGNTAVLVPVTIAISSTLLFIVATTVLPALQIWSLYFDFRSHEEGEWSNPPAQCPYKSPQSQAFLTIMRPMLTLSDRICPYVRRLFHAIRHCLKTLISTKKSTASTEDNFTRYLSSASTWSANWIRFDVAWLAIRDGYMRRAFKRSSVREKLGRSWSVDPLIGGRDNEILPIYDIIVGVSSQGYDKETSAPAYFAFCEISDLTLLPIRRPDYHYQTAEDLFRQSAYLHDLLVQGNMKNQEATLTDVFDLDDILFQPLKQPQGNAQICLNPVLPTLIHHQNTAYYLRYAVVGEAPLFCTHLTELRIRLIRYLSQEHPRLQNKRVDKKLILPCCLVLTKLESYLGQDFRNGVDFTDVAWQVANVILLVLQDLQVHHEQYPHSNTLVHSLLDQSILISFMDTAIFFTMRSLEPGPPSGSTRNHKLHRAVQDVFYSIFSMFVDRLNKEMLSWTSAEGQPSLTFYLAALYTQSLIKPLRNDARFMELYSMVRRYKRRTLDLGITNPTIEQQLKEDPNLVYYSFYYGDPFSSLWWHEFDTPSDPSNSNSSGQNTPSIVLYYPFNMSHDRLSQTQPGLLTPEPADV